MLEEFPEMAELPMNSVLVPCFKLLASSPLRISGLSKVSESDGFKPCHFECEGTQGFKQVCVLAW